MKEIKTPDGLLILTDREHQAALRREKSVDKNRRIAEVRKRQPRKRIG